MHRGFRFRLHPTPAQAETLGQWIGVTRLVYNLALEQRRDHWRAFRANEGRSISWVSQSAEVTALRAEYDWIKAVPRVCLEQAVRDLDKAFAAFFRGGGYPSPRRMGVNDSLRFQAKDVVVGRLNAKWATLRIPNLGWVKVRLTRAMPGDLLNVSVSRDSNGWQASFLRDIGASEQAASPLSVGVDRGVANTLSLSTGEHFRMPDMASLDRRKRKAQRILARRKRGSRRYAKQRARVASLIAKSARIRRDWCHKTSTAITRRFGVVAIEDLNIKGMTASAKGTVENPGRGVRQKAGLNRSILNQSWGTFATMLDYKLEATGGRLVTVPAGYTSQTCAACGVIDRQSRESQARFACVHCGHTDHADTNAAHEILRRSTAWLLGEGGQLGRPVEPRTLAA